MSETAVRDDVVKRVWEGPDDNERWGLCAGLFPARFMGEILNQHEAAALIKMAQDERGVRL